MPQCCKSVKYLCCVACPAGFTHIQSVNGCYKVLTSRRTWSAAGPGCRSLHANAHLLVVNDAQEQLAVAGMLSSASCQFIFSFFSLLSFLNWTLCLFWLLFRRACSVAHSNTILIYSSVDCTAVLLSVHCKLKCKITLLLIHFIFMWNNANYSRWLKCFPRALRTHWSRLPATTIPCCIIPLLETL